MIACTILSALLLGAAEPAATVGPALHTAADLNAFADDPRRRYTPFCITGTVQAVDTPSQDYIVVSDSSSWVEIKNGTDYRPVAGEVLALAGLAHMSLHQEIDIEASTVASVGTGSVEAPVSLPLGDISEADHHLRAIITEGTVIDAFPDEIDARNLFIILKYDEHVLPVAVRIAPGDASLVRLRDARVRIKGRFMRTVSGGRKFSGPFIAVNDRSDITVVAPAPDDPFVAPPLEKNLYRTPREIARSGKRTVSGEVLAVWSGNRLMVRTADERIVNITLAHGQAVPDPGTVVTAAGYPETDLFRVNLSRARVRVKPTAPAQMDEAAVTDIAKVFSGTGGQNAIDPASHGRLMRVRGLVQSISSPEDSGRRILLACGPHKLLVDLGQHPESAEDIDIGSELEVTGRCLLEIDRWTPDDIFPRIRNLAIVVRSPDDVKVLARPPWWTPMRLLVVISILVVALIGVYIWNRFLQKLVNRRGRELYREQVAHAIAEFKTDERTRLAVELHDSLSQELAGVACQVAASSKTLEKNPSVSRKCLETAEKMLNSCRTGLRQCLFDLRSDTLEEPDFSRAIRKTLGQLDGDTAIAIRFNVPRRRLKDTTAHAILSIVRELTGNAIRHGGATEVKIAGCIESGRILFSVKDNGCGFDPDDCDGPLQGHFGLEGIRNRLEKLEGTLSIESKPGNGTRVTVAMPAPTALPRESHTP